MSPDLLIDAHAILGEGPALASRGADLFWVDIEGHAVHDTDTATRDDMVIPVGEQVGCVAPAGERLLVVGLRSGFAALDLETGRRVHIEDPEHHLPDNRFNDGKCDPAGRFWAGTMAVSEERGLRVALLPRTRPSPCSCKVPGVSVSNGLAWSLDEKTMYFVDSPERRVVAWRLRRADGRHRPRAHGVRCARGLGLPRRDDHRRRRLPVGRAVGRLPRAPHRSRRAARSSRIEMPVSRPTSCAFGGAALDELYITSASIDLTDEQRAAQPHAGGVFVCRPGVQGLPAAEFAGAAELGRLFL